jgi:hypothetical protein
VPDELDDLIRKQGDDAGSRRVRVPRGDSVRTVNLGRRLDSLPQEYSRRWLEQSNDEHMRPADHDWIYLEGRPGWSMIEHARAAIGVDPCPVCGGHPRKLAYCLSCDRTGMDRAIGNRWPGKPVGAAMRDDETAKSYRGQPKYQPTMKGGKGS